MPDKPPSENMILVHYRDGVPIAGRDFQLTLEQITSLERIAWSLFPDAGNAGPVYVALAAVSLAAEHPGHFISNIRSAKLILHNFTTGGQTTAASPPS